LGCVGSIHYALSVHGKAAHSARPWQGENALYKAWPIVDAFSKLEPKKQHVFGVDFFDVMTITESQSSPGRTTVPDTWQANINYRFSPVHSLAQAKTHVPQRLDVIGVDYKLSCLHAVDAGAVIPHPLLESLKASFQFEAKQAWTDVAQLTARGICAFNFGPGRQDQAHHPNEYVVIADMLQYEQLLKIMLLEAS
jgi:succinyl-diaminopimelate desuccinylase